MPERLRWLGQGPKVLFLPGWNTPSDYLGQAIPGWFLDSWHCALLEWPGMGRRRTEPPPAAMDGMLAEITCAMQDHAFAGSVGFCLGGVAAWEHARRTQAGHPMLVMVESPYHFPAVLAPVLLPGIGAWLFRGFTREPRGRAWIERMLFRKGAAVPPGFWDAFGGTPPATAQAFLRILKQYERHLPARPDQPQCSCHRITGQQSPRHLARAWGHRHAIQAVEHLMPGVGHFPAAEAPEAFFRLLAEQLASAKDVPAGGPARGSQANGLKKQHDPHGDSGRRGI
jgi:pimeloyl-ACP methyl ester carboxylesterase